MRIEAMGYRRWAMGLGLIALLFALPASAEPLRSEDVALEITYLVASAIDRAQTMEIARHPDRYEECNTFLGKHPSKGRVNTLFAIDAVVHPLVTWLLPPQARPYWQGITLGVRVGSIARNASIGLKVRF